MLIKKSVLREREGDMFFLQPIWMKYYIEGEGGMDQ
jgi:hypothetical protein